MIDSKPNIQALLIDADGVVQTTKRSFLQELRALCPDPEKAGAFVEQVFLAEKPCLIGAAEFPVELTKVFSEWGVELPIAEALDIWRQITPIPVVLDAVSTLRARGIRVCLATNQQSHRARIMADHLNYASLFDELYFSCELGAAKPSGAFFAAILEQLQIDAVKTLFIDDQERNVAAAAEIGIHAELYHVDNGDAAFTSILARYGLPV